MYYDFEFCFTNGAVQCLTAVDGRDTIAADDQRVRLELHQDADTVEEVIISRSQLAYMRTTKRTVHPPATIDSAGLVLVGVNG